MNQLNFKTFVELHERQPNYLDAIQDELGIDTTAFKGNPEWISNLSLGNFSYNGIMYKIAEFVRKNGRITGAMIEPMNIAGNKTQRAYFNSDDKKIRMPSSDVSTKQQFISVEDLNKMLTQGFAGTGQAGSAMLPGGAMPF